MPTQPRSSIFAVTTSRSWTAARSASSPRSCITDAAGRQHWLRTIKRPLSSDAGPRDQLLGVATDITEQRAAAAALADNAAVAAALARVGEGIIAGVNRDDLLERLCMHTCTELGADSAQVWLLDADQEVYRPTCRFGETNEWWEAVRLLSAPAAVVEPHRIAGDRDGAAWIAARDLVMPYRLLAEGMHGIVWIALRRSGGTAGTLLASYRDAPPPGERELRIARGISQLASLALENARLHDSPAAGQQSQVGVHGDDVARAAHAAERDHRLRRVAARGRHGPAPDASRWETLQRMHENAVQLLDLINATLDVSRLETGQHSARPGDRGPRGHRRRDRGAHARPARAQR